jgi:putative spermidine/putrescine transport system permease protein
LRGLVSLVPGLAILGVFFLVPMLELVRMSVLRHDSVQIVTAQLTLANYRRIFSDPSYISMVLTSLQIGLATTLVALLVGYPLAYYLTTILGWERTLISAVCLLPMFVTVVVGTLGWFIMLLPFGVAQRTLHALGLVDGPLRLLNSLQGLVAVMVFLEAPYAILILASGIQNVGQDKVHAARVLGASTAQIFRKVMIPLTMPAIVSSAILVFSLSISSYLVPALITGGTLRLLPLAIFTYTTDVINWPFASALAVVLLVLVLGVTYTFTAVTNRLTARGKWEVV